MEKFSYRYPHPAVSADCVVFGFKRGRFEVLLVERGAAPYKGSWAFPGGFMEIVETAEQTAHRELREETGLCGVDLEQLGAFSDVERDPRERVLTVAFYGVVRSADCRAVAGDDAAKVRWFPLSKLPKLAFDHGNILSQAIERLKLNLFASLHGRDRFPWVFTAEEQRMMEAAADCI